MEDLHVHEVQQGMKVSKESSSATLGAMLPQVPPDKTIIKKKEGIDDMIPETRLIRMPLREPLVIWHIT